MENIPNFSIFFFDFFWFPVSRIVPKHVKGGTLGVFEHLFFCKIDKKMTGGPFGDFCEKKSHKAEKKLHKKILVKGGTRTHVLLLGRPQKSRNQVAVKYCGSEVMWQ